MKHQAVRMDFTMKELRYFLFVKKICPVCGGKLQRRNRWETKLGAEFHSIREPFLADNARVKYYSYYFTCPACGREYTLTELAEQ